MDGNSIIRFKSYVQSKPKINMNKEIKFNVNGVASMDGSGNQASSGVDKAFGRGLSQIIRHASSEVSKDPSHDASSQPPKSSQVVANPVSSQAPSQESSTPKGLGVPLHSPMAMQASSPSNAAGNPRFPEDIKDSVASLFFAEADLSLGKNMNLHFTKGTNDAPFLPREVINSLPFSVSALPEILHHFNLKANSRQAMIMKETLEYCDDTKGDDKCCTSLESMVDFATMMVGKQLKAISANLDKDMKMEFKVQNIKKLPSTPKAITCHKIPFPCAVFYCEKIEHVTVFIPTLVGADGTRIHAPAICHDDTDSWDHNHWFFHENLNHDLPGSSGPFCHFLLDDDVLWIPQ